MILILLLLFLQNDSIIHVRVVEEEQLPSLDDLLASPPVAPSTAEITTHITTEPPPEPYTQLPNGSFACVYCDKKFPSKHNTIRHARRHTGEKPFKCFYCEFHCSQKINLLKHCESRHGMARAHFNHMANEAGMKY